MPEITPRPAEKLAYSVDEVVQITGLSRDLLYEQMRSGRLGYIKVGRRRKARRLSTDSRAPGRQPAPLPCSSHPLLRRLVTWTRSSPPACAWNKPPGCMLFLTKPTRPSRRCSGPSKNTKTGAGERSLPP